MKKKQNWAERKFRLQCSHNTSGDPQENIRQPALQSYLRW